MKSKTCDILDKNQIRRSMQVLVIKLLLALTYMRYRFGHVKKLHPRTWCKRKWTHGSILMFTSESIGTSTLPQAAPISLFRRDKISLSAGRLHEVDVSRGCGGVCQSSVFYIVEVVSPLVQGVPIPPNAFYKATCVISFVIFHIDTPSRDMRHAMHIAAGFLLAPSSGIFLGGIHGLSIPQQSSLLVSPFSIFSKRVNSFSLFHPSPGLLEYSPGEIRDRREPSKRDHQASVRSYMLGIVQKQQSLGRACAVGAATAVAGEST